MKTWRLPKGASLGVAMPPRVEEPKVDRKLQGGLPPVPYRSATTRWGEAAPMARDPFVSKQVRGEQFAMRRAVDGYAKGEDPDLRSTHRARR